MMLGGSAAFNNELRVKNEKQSRADRNEVIIVGKLIETQRLEESMEDSSLVVLSRKKKGGQQF